MYIAVFVYAETAVESFDFFRLGKYMHISLHKILQIYFVLTFNHSSAYYFSIILTNVQPIYQIFCY